MAVLQLCIILDFQIMASFCVLPRLNGHIAYQILDAQDHYKKVMVEVHRKISSINLTILFHIFLLPIFCLNLKELHNVSHSISNFYEHEFSPQFPSLLESNHKSLLLYLALRYKQYQNDSLNLLVIYLPNELLIFPSQSMGYQPNQKTCLNCSRLITRVLQKLL